MSRNAGIRLASFISLLCLMIFGQNFNIAGDSNLASSIHIPESSPLQISEPRSKTVINANTNVKVTTLDKLPRVLRLHLRGPLGLKNDVDEVIRESTRPELEFQYRLNVEGLAPGRYILYIDSLAEDGQRTRSLNTEIRIGPQGRDAVVLFDSDYAHILDVESPYNQNAYLDRMKEKSLTKEKIQAAFKEILRSGVDTLVLSPGVGELGYYRNSYYPMSRHQEWWQEFAGVSPPSEPNIAYVLKKNGDPIDDARDVTSILKKNLYVSIRMNDGHVNYDKKNPTIDRETGRLTAAGRQNPFVYRLYSEFLSTSYDPQNDMKIGDDPSLPEKSSYAHLLDYAKGILGQTTPSGLKRSVREHKLAILLAMLEEHNVDGLVLDFMRLSHLFNQSTTTSKERRDIMVAFLRDLRLYLDGEYRDKFKKTPKLVVRIPAMEQEWDRLGISVPEWSLAGVDVFVYSYERDWAQPFYFGKDGKQLLRLDRYAERVGPGVRYLYEINYATDFEFINIDHRRYQQDGKWVTVPASKDADGNASTSNWAVRRRSLDEQILSGAYSIYKLGGQGFYFFNMPYYRGINAYSDPENRVTPPFHLMSCLQSENCTGSKKHPYYFLAQRNKINFTSMTSSDFQLPDVEEHKEAIQQGKWKQINLFAPAPINGWSPAMKLRIEITKPISDLQVRIGARVLNPLTNADETIHQPFRYALSKPERTYAFEVPPEILLTEGRVSFEVKSDARDFTIRWVDLMGVDLPEGACYSDGIIFRNGSTSVFFKDGVSDNSACASGSVKQVRTCIDGTLSGDPLFFRRQCGSTRLQDSCQFKAKLLRHGESVTTYKDLNVPSGTTCISEERTCANGNLSGTFTNEACFVKAR